MERRVLVHTPRGRDADVVASVLAAADIASVVCASHDAMLAGLREGAAAAIVTEESLQSEAGGALARWLADQPSWSDFPFIVLATRQAGRRPAHAAQALHALGNVVLLERPVNAETLASAAEAAVRARNRQYVTRRNLQELGEARATVERLNRELEDRIAARTHELAAANDRLMAEINERERAQAALVHMQKMEAIGRLTGGIAHDFNNLLHVVSMNLELLVRQSPEAKVAAIAERARRAVSRGSRLTGQLLTFARAQSLLPRLTDVNALLLGMQELVAISTGATVAVELALSEGPAWVQLDPSQMEMAILNLAVNAKDAMPEGGRLLIATRVEDTSADELPAGQQVCVSVTDEGAGIPPHLLSKVFDPFFTTKPLGSGTGLGLSQVYGFAQQSGGSARIDSRVGEGTTVEMRFPMAAPQLQTQAPADGPAQATQRQHHILVVEDDAEVRRVLVDSLRFNGHRVMSASNGPDGLEMLGRQRPDLLIVDYAMPGMNGAEVIKQARESQPRLPVILATGYADMAEVGTVLGTQSILIKPFDIGTLLRAVSQAMQDGAR